ncbi:nucleotidyltransferase family protein [Psychroserpens sp.]|uniref:nucleotidyltransferase family protein n=1 Tax=Psychroserpens sp. TaxID=2020870 RepID=UPI001B29A578|nr:nucleotidyltransferase family protein [Psychroserpens sp.]MBO6605876.1 nucleotidyltransferase family protein [Psychroserpens sp.]MBO6632341.1 nucleotidyltransferase family protein [Psychroserpens sp.]MBO6652753.1 nucleotidyltransferase family protein [Psychroserpens sp.]MBO6681475.1 nucleotidyltransferase family protein [Psychroserpens sp.]MBO6749250.1 nucleotidyltransferase family protein [Psychroserpens sp.]
MIHYTEHLITSETPIRQALEKLNVLASDAIVFVVDNEQKLKGSLTDGDVRRGLLKGITIDQPVTEIIQQHPRFIRKGSRDIYKIIEYRKQNFRILPVIDSEDRVVNIVNFRHLRSYLPIDAVIMAGGRGERLRPLTDNTPKPLLKIGDKSIMEHNVDRLSLYGIDDFWFSVKYLGDQIESYFGDGTESNRSIKYVWEDEPMGTIGSVSKIDNFAHEHVLVSNSDILTNLDYEAFYLDFLEKDADLAVATIPYNVSVPYAVLETSNGHVLNFKEKPTYTYYSNGGIYLIKRSALQFIPKEKHFNATDLMERLIQEGLKVISYPLVGYWLDVGKHEDFENAKNDIHSIKF